MSRCHIQVGVLAWAAVLLASAACKSKLEKCEAVCDKIRAEQQAACAGDRACLVSLADSHDACFSLCDTAVGSGKRPSKSGEPTSATGQASDESKCDKGDKRACLDVAGRAIKATPNDYVAASRYLEKACNLGEQFACEMFAKALRDGKGVEKDQRRARELLDKACSAGAGGACTSVGLAEGPKTSKGRELLTRACELGDGTGCMAIGGIYLHGTGVPKDVAKAKLYLEKACKGGEAKACAKLAEIP